LLVIGTDKAIFGVVRHFAWILPLLRPLTLQKAGVKHNEKTHFDL
jgi:hypothetical protein